jgi:hypothetical protein
LKQLIKSGTAQETSAFPLKRSYRDFEFLYQILGNNPKERKKRGTLVLVMLLKTRSDLVLVDGMSLRKGL